MILFRRKQHADTDTLSKDKQSKHKEPADKFVDEPTDIDDLELFNPYVDPVVAIIAKGDYANRTPLTIGVYGEWGMGKTSFLKMVEKRMTEKEISPVLFSAWKYDKEDNLWAALLQTIINQAGKSISKDIHWYYRVWAKFQIWRYGISLKTGMWEMAKKLFRFLLRLLVITLCLTIVLGLGSNAIQDFLNKWLPGTPQVLLKVILGVTAFFAADPLKLIDLVKGDIGIDFSKFQRKLSHRDHIAFLDEFSEEFQRLIKQLRPNKQLVVIIDDLDRCLPKKALQVMEAIKAFLDIPGSVFLLGVNRRIVELALNEKFKDAFASNHDARKIEQMVIPEEIELLREEYFDKIIQIPIMVPRLQETQINKFIKRLNKIGQDVNYPDIEQCAEIFGLGLPPNPRKIKRTLRTFLFVREVIKNSPQSAKIKIPLLAKLIAIKHKYPKIYGSLFKQPKLLAELESYYRGRVYNPDAFDPKSASGEQAESYASEYPELPSLLLKKTDEDDNFVDADIRLYIPYLSTFAQIESFVTAQTPQVGKEATAETQVSLTDKNAAAITTATPSPVSVPPARQMSWNVPYRRNQLFTAREDVLHRMRAKLAQKPSTSTSIVALCGLGGIGKTQIAIEYAYRFSQDYRAVFWARASAHDETRDQTGDEAHDVTLISDFLAIAEILKLPEKDEQDQQVIIAAVRRWLDNNTKWLLILDDVTNIDILSKYLPTYSDGHVLLTTRLQVKRTTINSIEVNSIEVNSLEIDDGVMLLLRRARMLDRDALVPELPPADIEIAEEIVQQLGGLPLALDQAGAYIEETVCSLSHYLNLYRNKSATLLERRGGFGSDYPVSFATTVLLVLQEVERKAPGGIELLRLCALLAPDAIPENIITQGAAELGPKLGPIAANTQELHKIVEELTRLALIRYNPDTTLITIHHLVQTVIKNEMNDQTQREWAVRAIRAVSRVFPIVESVTLSESGSYIEQALACADLIDQWDLPSAEAVQLMDRAGSYLRARAQYDRAEKLLQRALEMREQISGSEHLDVATSLNNLALLYHAQGRYSEAEFCYKRALEIQERALGKEHLDVAASLNNLALIYQAQGRYSEAEPLYKRTLRIREHTPGKEHLDVAASLNNLALIYQAQGRYSEAEPLYQRALEMRERAQGEEHPDVAIALSNLASIYHVQGRFNDAEPLLQRALAIRENTFGANNPDVATSLNNLAGLYNSQGRFNDAEPLLQRALAIREHTLGEEHPDVATSLNNLAGLYFNLGKYSEAEPLYRHALAIRERVLEPGHPSTLISLNNLALLYQMQGDDLRAEERYRQALAAFEQANISDNSDVIGILVNYATLLHQLKRQEEAEGLEGRVRNIQKQLGNDNAG